MVYSKNLWGSLIKKISSCFLCFICPHSSSHSSFLLFFIPPLTPLFFKEYLFCSSSLLFFSSPHSPLQHLPSPSRSFFFSLRLSTLLFFPLFSSSHISFSFLHSSYPHSSLLMYPQEKIGSELTMGQNQVILRHRKFTFPRARE